MKEKNSNRSARRAFPWRSLLGSLALILAVLGGFVGLRNWKLAQFEAAAQGGAPPEMPTPVTIESVQPLTYRNSTSAIGTILAPRSISVNNELAGTVTEVRLEPGHIVNDGDILLQQDVSVEQAELKSAVSRQALARTTFERNEQLTRSGAITQTELDTVRSQYQQAQAEVEQLEALIARKTIKAPFRGRIGICDVHKGQYLAPGTMITTLQSIEDHLLVDFSLPQGIDSQVQERDTIRIKSNVGTQDATVQAIDAQADRVTRNVRVRARIDHPLPGQSPGDSVQVTVEYGSPIVLPGVRAEALQYSPQGNFVYVAELDADKRLRARLRPVMPGTSVGNQIGIAQGLQVGDRVVTSGAFKLRNDMLIEDASAPSTDAPASMDEKPTTKTSTSDELDDAEIEKQKNEEWDKAGPSVSTPQASSSEGTP